MSVFVEHRERTTWPVTVAGWIKAVKPKPTGASIQIRSYGIRSSSHNSPA
jgi:hypothetical protein